MTCEKKRLDNMQEKQELECQFGRIEYDNDEVLSLHEGLYGYEEYKRYLVWINDQYLPFQWLVCVDNPQLMFPVIDPKIICPEYDPKVNNEEPWDSILNIVSIGNSMESVTVNLRAPILISNKQHLGKQVVLSETNYPLRHKIIN